MSRENYLEIDFEIELFEDDLWVEGECVKWIRVYEDDGWELLNSKGLPIIQGKASARRKTRVFDAKPEEKS